MAFLLACINQTFNAQFTSLIGNIADYTSKEFPFIAITQSYRTGERFPREMSFKQTVFKAKLFVIYKNILNKKK